MTNVTYMRYTIDNDLVD